MKKITEEIKPMRYKGAALDNIWLVNGYHVKKTRYGNAISIEDVEGLHRAIGQHLVENRVNLTGAEFRFLRKAMELSQRQLGRFIGVGEQAIAKWEKTSKVQRYGDRFIRVLYREFEEGNAGIRELVKHLNSMDSQKRGKYYFQETREDGWVPDANAA